jgi:hypothetical protein
MEEEQNPWADENEQFATDEHQKQTLEVPKTPVLRPPSPRRIVREPPRSPSKKMSQIHGLTKDLIFGVCIVNFHHLRGPEIEYSKVSEDCTVDPVYAWPYLPFQALPDGAHSFEETFAYFTLEYPNTTLFAISCARQISSDELLEKDKDVTRSSVQKSLVVILRQPIYGQIKEKLSIVTKSFFDQKNFNDTSIVNVLYQNLKEIYSDDSTSVDESEFYAGISLRELLRDYKKDVLVILKAMILEKRVAFYGSNPTSLCLTEFAFISLIPNLINNLLDCSSPALNHYAETLQMTTSFQTSDRNSVLSFAGLPLQIFGKDSIFSPYSPLQQFEDLKSIKHYMIGTSNALLLNHKAQMCDLLVNLDTKTIEILDHHLQQSLQLTSHDKKWISQMVQSVVSSWGDSYSGFVGSDDYIRWQFEDYLTGLLATVKYNNYVTKFTGAPPHDLVAKDFDTNQLRHFNTHFVNQWKETLNYQLFDKTTDDHIFDVFEPKHIYSDETKSLSEKFHIFKTENAKKFDEYRRSLGSREHKDYATADLPKDDAERKSTSPSRLWGWYSKKSKE